jgi:hypothetical protein
MRRLALAAALLIAATASAGTRDNDSTCDIKVGPAATLLLPYFEVDLSSPLGQTTLFTVTNISRYPQIAHVTLWSDLAYPVLDFNLFLAGYDTQAINLFDVIAGGVIAPPAGTSSATTPGSLSAPNTANGYLDPSTFPCSSAVNLPPVVRNAVKAGLTAGVYNPGGDFHGGGTACSRVGRVHANAAGYVTIDVVSHCTSRLPTDPLYYTTDLLFDNVLIGDYQQLGAHAAGTAAGAFIAGGNPMVHIRAVPEGGGAGSIVATDLPYTFYDRYTPADHRTVDRRQPLPATFAARYIQGGTSAFATNLSIWREGYAASGASCADYAANDRMAYGEIVRFDEHENPFVLSCFGLFGYCYNSPALPPTSSTNTIDSYLYPYLLGTDVAGWLYLNVSNCGSKKYSVTNATGFPTNIPGALSPAGSTNIAGPRPSQNWVTVTMFGKVGSQNLSAEFDAASLGNGCSPAPFLSEMRPIAPAGGVFVCPPGPALTNGTTALCTGTNVNPKP